MAAVAQRLSVAPKAAARDRVAGLFDPLLRVWTGAVYAFFFLPILFVIIFSFNSSRLVGVWGGFSLKWYGTAWTDHAVLEKYLGVTQSERVTPGRRGKQ